MTFKDREKGRGKREEAKGKRQKERREKCNFRYNLPHNAERA
jgi:hypothetical protein